MIIDSSYFLNKMVFIPNTVSQPSIGSNTPTNVDTLKGEIEDREKELLISILGYTQYLELKDQFVETTPGVWNWVALPVQKWKDLVDGKENWLGLRYTIGGKKVSLIANYVFCKYLEDDYSAYTTTGTVISDAANSTQVNPTQKITIAWNKFVEMLNGYNRCSRSNRSLFQHWNWDGIQYGQKDQIELNLFDFMQLYPDNYDVSNFQIRTVVNSLGL